MLCKADEVNSLSGPAKALSQGWTRDVYWAGPQNHLESDSTSLA